jgi:hypothetical protein
MERDVIEGAGVAGEARDVMKEYVMNLFGSQPLGDRTRVVRLSPVLLVNSMTSVGVLAEGPYS